MYQFLKRAAVNACRSDVCKMPFPFLTLAAKRQVISVERFHAGFAQYAFKPLYPVIARHADIMIFKILNVPAARGAWRRKKQTKQAIFHRSKQVTPTTRRAAARCGSMWIS
jgi:hypothetical protein